MTSARCSAPRARSSPTARRRAGPRTAARRAAPCCGRNAGAAPSPSPPSPRARPPRLERGVAAPARARILEGLDEHAAVGALVHRHEQPRAADLADAAGQQRASTRRRAAVAPRAPPRPDVAVNDAPSARAPGWPRANERSSSSAAWEPTRRRAPASAPRARSERMASGRPRTPPSRVQHEVVRDARADAHAAARARAVAARGEPLARRRAERELAADHGAERARTPRRCARAEPAAARARTRAARRRARGRARA